MKALLRLLLAGMLALSAIGAHAQRAYSPGELEALLAPIALYADPLLSQILDASRYPQDVAAAAAWARANPQLSGDALLASVQSTAWPPSVKALVASPEMLARMAESPQWLQDLGEAYTANAPEVMATVQELRARAQASGYLQSNDEQYVTQQGAAIVVQPVAPSVVYAPWYDPFVVYGAWGWGFRPVFWRPWVARPVVVTHVVVAPPVRWFVHRTPQFHAQFRAQARPRIVQGGPAIRPFRAVPESQHAPIVRSGGSAFIHSGGPAFVHSGGPAFVRSGGAFVHGGGAHAQGGHGHGGGRR